jgi:hypothetical protein
MGVYSQYDKYIHNLQQNTLPTLHKQTNIDFYIDYLSSRIKVEETRINKLFKEENSSIQDVSLDKRKGEILNNIITCSLQYNLLKYSVIYNGKQQ